MMIICSSSKDGLFQFQFFSLNRDLHNWVKEAKVFLQSVIYEN